LRLQPDVSEKLDNYQWGFLSREGKAVEFSILNFGSTRCLDLSERIKT